MIRINLLPDEFRRSERTAPKVFAATLLAVVLVCSAIGWFGLVYFGEYGNLEAEHAQTSEERNNKQRRAKYYDALDKETKKYQQRIKTIQDISKSRVLWAEVLDQTVDVVNNDGDTERHLAWFKGVSVKSGDGKRRGPTMTMPGWVQGSSMKRVADFHEDLSNMPNFVDVREKSAPQGTVSVDAKRIPPEALFFNLSWTYNPPQKWLRHASNKKKGK